MNKAILTKDGARRLNVPHLSDKEVEYDGALRSGNVAGAKHVYHDGKYIGGTLAFTGDMPGLIDDTEAWRQL